MTRNLRTAVAAAIAVCGGVAGAAEKLGVEVYPGAKQLPLKSAYVKAATSAADAHCYRTSDKPEAVARFVLRQAGFQARERYLLRRRDVDVVIRSPAAVPGATGPTVFCILPAKD